MDRSSDAPMFKEAQQAGAFRGRFIGNWVKRLDDAMRPYLKERGGGFKQGMGDMFYIAKKVPADLYQGAEIWGKYSLYKHLRDELHYTPQKAAEAARSALFDYSEIPALLGYLRNLPVVGKPFAIFPYKAIPELFKQAVKHPVRIGKYPLAFYLIEEAVRQKFGYSKKDWEDAKNLLPSYVQSGGGIRGKIAPNYIPLPSRDARGNIKWLNVGYSLPWGQLGENPSTLARDIKSKTGIPLPSALTPSEPMFSLAKELVTGKDFIGRNIVPPGASNLEALSATGAHIYRTIAPPMLPPPLEVGLGYAEKAIPALKNIPSGYTGENIRRAISKRESYRGDVPLMENVLPGAGGIKLYSWEPIKEMRNAIFATKAAVQSIQDDYRRTTLDKSITEEVRKDRQARLQRDLQKVLLEFKTKYRDNSYAQGVMRSMAQPVSNTR
jgi:hypothetical protein